MEIDKLTEQILEITNNSDYGWIDLDSADADRIRVALTQAMNYIPCCTSKAEQLVCLCCSGSGLLPIKDIKVCGRCDGTGLEN
jgi:hypothetical protein